MYTKSKAWEVGKYTTGAAEYAKRHGKKVVYNTPKSNPKDYKPTPEDIEWMSVKYERLKPFSGV
jgi:hypothetical protein